MLKNWQLKRWIIEFIFEVLIMNHCAGLWNGKITEKTCQTIYFKREVLLIQVVLKNISVFESNLIILILGHRLISQSACISISFMLCSMKCVWLKGAFRRSCSMLFWRLSWSRETRHLYFIHRPRRSGKMFECSNDLVKLKVRQIVLAWFMFVPNF